MRKLSLASAIALTFSALTGAAVHASDKQSGDDIRAFQQTCQQERRVALRSCRTTFDAAVEKLVKGGTSGAGDALAVENTLLSLCEMEADRTFDYCRIAAHFQGTTIVEVLQQDGLGPDALMPSGDNDLLSDDIVPLLSGSNYRTISQLCFYLPGFGSTLRNWTGIDLRNGCLDDAMDACLNDPQMGSDASGSATHPDHRSEREQNCYEAIFMWDIPTL